jgi:hypothetical protein
MCDFWRPNWVIVASTFLCVWTLACDSDGQLRDDARRFLTLHEAIRYDAPSAERAAKVDELARIALGEEAVRAVRDMCVTAHRALLTEQAVQDENAAKVEQALAHTRDGSPLPPATLELLRKGLGDSSAAISRAQEQLQNCEAQARSLGLRFGRR